MYHHTKKKYPGTYQGANKPLKWRTNMSNTLDKIFENVLESKCQSLLSYAVEENKGTLNTGLINKLVDQISEPDRLRDLRQRMEAHLEFEIKVMIEQVDN